MQNSDEVKISDKFPLVVVLDRIRSAYNVGSVLRTADCAGIEEVITTDFTPPADYFRVHKTSLGAEKTVKTRHYDTLAEAIETLKEEGYKIFAIETGENAKNLWEIELPKEKTAIILGHEVDGVQMDIISKYDIVPLEIPMFGEKESLNVANASAIAIYDIIKRWH